VRACRIDRAPRASTPWRLTDRGIALVLALTAMIVVAAVTVIGLTAWRVTAPGYQTSGVSQQLSSR
jgi:Tfp pilus assembly protein PilX